MARPQLHAPANNNVSGVSIPAGLTISPQSELSATDLLNMIGSATALPQALRNLFFAKRNRIIVLEGTPGIPVNSIPDWFIAAMSAINRGRWHLTTGTVNVDRTTPLFMEQKILGDYESGDIPAGGKRSIGIVAGETVASQSGGSFMGLRKVTDESAGGGPGSALRRPPIALPGGGTDFAEGLVVIGNRFRDVAHNGPEVARASGSILETFFHELAAHADQIDNGHSGDHSDGNYYVVPITDADNIAKDVHDFFANPDEAPLIQQATVNVWERAKQDGSPPSSAAPGANAWEQVKSSQ
jgi:hypothetical protein